MKRKSFVCCRENPISACDELNCLHCSGESFITRSHCFAFPSFSCTVPYVPSRFLPSLSKNVLVFFFNVLKMDCTCFYLFLKYFPLFNHLIFFFLTASCVYSSYDIGQVLFGSLSKPQCYPKIPTFPRDPFSVT